MIGTACFYILLSLVTGRFFKRSRAFKKDNRLFKKEQELF